MKQYFFMPATKLNKLKATIDLEVDLLIIDLEDSVLKSDREMLINEICSKKELYINYWFRIPLRNSYDSDLNVRLLEQFLNAGYRKIVIPKIIDFLEFKIVFSVISRYEELEIILLIEHPKLLLQLNKILELDMKNIIVGLGLGSHDLMSFISAKHEEKRLYFARMQCLYNSKAYGRTSIDIASMNVDNDIEFKAEVINGINDGFDAKFVIHPKQSKWLKECLDNDDEVKWAQKILNILPKNTVASEIEPFIFEGKIIEKPHIEKAKKILRNRNYEI